MPKNIALNGCCGGNTPSAPKMRARDTRSIARSYARSFVAWYDQVKSAKWASLVLLPFCDFPKFSGSTDGANDRQDDDRDEEHQRKLNIRKQSANVPLRSCLLNHGHSFSSKRMIGFFSVITGTAVFKNSSVDRDKSPFNYWFRLAFEYGLFAWLFSLFILGKS